MKLKQKDVESRCAYVLHTSQTHSKEYLLGKIKEGETLAFSVKLQGRGGFFAASGHVDYFRPIKPDDTHAWFLAYASQTNHFVAGLTLDPRCALAVWLRETPPAKIMASGAMGGLKYLVLEPRRRKFEQEFPYVTCYIQPTERKQQASELEILLRYE